MRIMSIHKSKGLEFPITFVSGLAKRFNMQDVNQSFLMDMDYGLGTDFVDVEGRVRNKTLRKLVVSRKMREENLAEELRVLYVPRRCSCRNRWCRKKCGCCMWR